MDTPSTRGWAERGTCRVERIPVEVMFPGEKTDPVEAAKLRRAKRACGRCPVASECLQYAVRTGQRGGVWGGLTEYQRDRLGESDLQRRPTNVA